MARGGLLPRLRAAVRSRNAGAQKRRSTAHRNTDTMGVAAALHFIFEWRRVGAYIIQCCQEAESVEGVVPVDQAFKGRLEKLVCSTHVGKEVMIMAATKQDRRLSEERLGFRVHEPTKALIERAAQLERRKLTDFCMTALTEAARRTIAEHETIMLSDRDRAVFFDTLVNPRDQNERLQRAFAEHQRRVVR